MNQTSTLADRCDQDASSAVYYAERAGRHRLNALMRPTEAKVSELAARACERQVVKLANKLQVRLRLLADQGPKA